MASRQACRGDQMLQCHPAPNQNLRMRPISTPTETQSKDITDQRFGMLQAIEQVESRHGQKGARWMFACDCGNFTEQSATQVRQGLVTSCGCKQHKGTTTGRAGHDLAGKTFGLLRVESLLDDRHEGRRRWRCMCECGAYVNVVSSNLTRGLTRSCGCLRRKHDKQRLF